MRIIAVTLSLLAALVMSGCATLNSNVAKVSDSQQLDTLCNVAPAVHLAFVAIATQTNISQTVQQREYEAWIVLRELCEDRPADVAGALITAITAYQHILAAQAEAAAIAKRST